jgi:NAD(P)-dependent dehydrogenase (short-subunit alcohol dehydrogenase family)
MRSGFPAAQQREKMSTQVVLITGGLTGIGRAAAVAFAKKDAKVALVDRTVARFGRLDVAVNNAGTEGQVGPITDQTAESNAATFDTNVLGVLLSMKHELRLMQEQGSGNIINVDGGMTAN